MFLYIDPGTGSMLFTILVGIATAAVFALRGFFLKLGFFLKGGRAEAKGRDVSNHPYVIFSDSKRYWNIFRPICMEFERRGIPVEYWTMSPDDPALDEKFNHVRCLFIGEGNAAFAKLNMMSADICLATTPGLDVYQWKRSRNVKRYVHITHDICSITSYRMFGVDFFDSILLPGRNLVPELREIEKLRGLPAKDVAIVGSTYMDGLKKQFDSWTGESHEGITVLIAPSWGASSILNRFGSRFLKAMADTGFNIIVRPHPQSFKSDPELMSSLQKEFPESDHFSWNTDNDNFAVMGRSDILISDFSGIIFDFAFTFGRPVIYADTDLDLAPYDDCWLPEEPWRLKIIRDLGRQLREEDFGMMREFITGILNDREYGEQRETIRTQAWENQGEAAIRVADYLIDLHSSITDGGSGC